MHSFVIIRIYKYKVQPNSSSWHIRTCSEARVRAQGRVTAQGQPLYGVPGAERVKGLAQAPKTGCLEERRITDRMLLVIGKEEPSSAGYSLQAFVSVVIEFKNSTGTLKVTECV